MRTGGDVAMRVTRRLVLALPALLAACGDDTTPPPDYPPLSFDYLPPLKIDVGRIDIDDAWAPRGAARHVEYLAPESPRAALAQMARDRLVTGGVKGVASFIIQDASLVRAAQSYEANFAVRLDIADDSGTRLGGAVASINQVRPVRGESDEAVRGELYDFVRDAMRAMNVEFEFQVRKALQSMLQATDAVAPSAAPVQTEDLNAPGVEPKLVPLTPP